MKVELIKYQNDDNNTRWKIVNDGKFVNVYLDAEEAIEGFDKYVRTLQEPKFEPEIIKSVEL